MNCPQCSKAMAKWQSEVYDEEDQVPTFVQLSGYGCQDCRRTFLSLDGTDFDGYTIGKSIIQGGNLGMVFIPDIDPRRAEVLRVENLYIREETEVGTIFHKVQ